MVSVMVFKPCVKEVGTQWLKYAWGFKKMKVDLKYCMEMMENPMVDPLSISKSVLNIIGNLDHFTENAVMVQILKLVVTAIGHLEIHDTTLVDIWKELVNN